MGRRILIADDSITIQKVVELTFSEFDDEVVSVGNGALAQARLAEETFDIALLDAVMPERTGYDLCAGIRKDDRISWMPVLLLSGAFETFDEARGRQVGADGHLRKPFESRSLMAKVDELVAARPRPGAPPALARPRPRPEPAPIPSPPPRPQTPAQARP
ncbi:MAG: response regulator, partial [Candidatus Polarisedimenticolia bacterium]